LAGNADRPCAIYDAISGDKREDLGHGPAHLGDQLAQRAAQAFVVDLVRCVSEMFEGVHLSFQID